MDLQAGKAQAQDGNRGTAPLWDGIERRRVQYDRRISSDRRQGDRRGLGGSDDPMNLYLRDMGDLNLLSQEEELGLARMVEEGEKRIQTAILRLTLGVTALEDLAAGIERGAVKISTILKGLPENEGDEVIQAQEDLLARIQDARDLSQQRDILFVNLKQAEDGSEEQQKVVEDILALAKLLQPSLLLTASAPRACSTLLMLSRK